MPYRMKKLINLMDFHYVSLNRTELSNAYNVIKDCRFTRFFFTFGFVYAEVFITKITIVDLCLILAIFSYFFFGLHNIILRLNFCDNILSAECDSVLHLLVSNECDKSARRFDRREKYEI